MKFNTQVCTTIEQSERLLALGLKKETADMTLVSFDDTTIMELIGQTSVSRTTIKINGTEVQTEDLRHIPAWSLHRLIDMCPNCIIDRQPCLHKTILNKSIHYCEENFKEEYEVFFDMHLKMYDNLIDCIEWLINNNYFNKQYLNESL